MLKRTEFRCLLGLTMAFLTIASWLTLSTYSAGQPAISAAATTAVAQEAGVTAYVKQFSPVPTKDLVYDPMTRWLFVSIPSTHRAYPNSVTSFTLPSTALVSTVYAGSEPGKLALSDESLFLYVSLDGSGSVRAFNQGLQPVGREFYLGNSSFNGPMYVEDMAVLPGKPDSIAISRRNLGISPKHEGVAIYDNGDQRPNTTPNHTGSNAIEFSASASTLYGYNNETSEFGLRKMTVDDTGVSVASVTQNLISGYNIDIKFDNGLIYTTSGRVIDPEAGTLRGTFALDSQFGNLVCPESSRGRVYFLTGSGASTTLRAFDQRTFAPRGSVSIPGASGTASSLIRWGTNGFAFRTSADQLFILQTTLVPGVKHLSDIDGDDRNDVAVWRSSNASWYVKKTQITRGYIEGYSARRWGVSTDKPVPGDYDGDYKTDLAVFRPAEGRWYISQSVDNSFRAQQWGSSTDKPVPGDYDGDGKTDLAVFRPQEGVWYILQSSDNTFRARQWGVNTDKPVPADYDNDGRIDLAVFRPSTGYFYILQSSDNSFRAKQWGMNGDMPVIGDYDGDGKIDLAVYRSSNNYWYILQSSNGLVKAQRWGAGGDQPVPGDYDGDGRADIVMFRPGNNSWHILNSYDGRVGLTYFGTQGDLPLSSAYSY